MKKIIIFALNAIINLFIFFVLYFILDNIGSLTIMSAGSLFSEYGAKYIWSEFIQNKIIFFIVATAILSFTLNIVYVFAMNFSKTRVKFAMATVAGLFIVIMLMIFYWKYIQTNCYGIEWSNIELALSENYGDNDSQMIFWIVYSCIVFLTGMTLNNFNLFVNNLYKKIILGQIISREDFLYNLLYLGVPWCIYFSSFYFIVGFLGLPIKGIILISSIFFVAVMIIKRTIQFKTLYNYYSNIDDSNSSARMVIVQESPLTSKSFFVHYLIKHGSLSLMKEKKILFCPYGLGYRPDKFLRLDVYDEGMLFLPNEQRKSVIESMMELKGTYNLLFSPDVSINSPNSYYRTFKRYNDLVDEIIRLSDFLTYYTIVSSELYHISLDRFPVSNLLIAEISKFKTNIEKITDNFQIFDYEIKWLEILNYFFALIMISKNQISITEEVRSFLSNADFNKWRRFLDENVDRDNDLKNVMWTSENESFAFKSFDNIWFAVTSSHYIFSEYSTQEMLNACNRLRDYTRGHGVFTFEISQEINIELIRVLVFIVNRLLIYLDSIDNLDNLDNMGWLIYSADDPYYLYYFDDKFKQYKYESFQTGKSISLPIDRIGDAV